MLPFLLTKVHCEWGDWPADWGVCSQDCGGGSQSKTRVRTVDAEFLGDECVGDEEIVQSCNMTACDDERGK